MIFIKQRAVCGTFSQQKWLLVSSLPLTRLLSPMSLGLPSAEGEVAPWPSQPVGLIPASSLSGCPEVLAQAGSWAQGAGKRLPLSAHGQPRSCSLWEALPGLGVGWWTAGWWWLNAAFVPRPA